VIHRRLYLVPCVVLALSLSGCATPTLDTLGVRDQFYVDPQTGEPFTGVAQYGMFQRCGNGHAHARLRDGIIVDSW